MFFLQWPYKREKLPQCKQINITIEISHIFFSRSLNIRWDHSIILGVSNTCLIMGLTWALCALLLSSMTDRFTVDSLLLVSWEEEVLKDYPSDGLGAEVALAPSFVFMQTQPTSKGSVQLEDLSREYSTTSSVSWVQAYSWLQHLCMVGRKQVTIFISWGQRVTFLLISTVKGQIVLFAALSSFSLVCDGLPCSKPYNPPHCMSTINKHTNTAFKQNNILPETLGKAMMNWWFGKVTSLTKIWLSWDWLHEFWTRRAEVPDELSLCSQGLQWRCFNKPADIYSMARSCGFAIFLLCMYSKICSICSGGDTDTAHACLLPR